MTSMREKAAKLAERGLCVSQIGLHGRPDEKAAFRETSSDPNHIREHWAGDGYNLAVATGEGFVVVDVDQKNGRDGLGSLEKLGLELEGTLTAKTPSGGKHLFYRAKPRPEGYRTRLHGLPWDGIDLKGAGGYVVAAGSRKVNEETKIVGPEYVWEDPDAPILDLPDFIADQMVGRRKAADPGKLPDFVDDDAAIESATIYLTRDAPPAMGGTGHATALQVINRAMDFGVKYETALGLMVELWGPRCDPVWDDLDDLGDHTRGIVNSRTSSIGCDHPSTRAPVEAFGNPTPRKFITAEECCALALQGSAKQLVPDYLDFGTVSVWYGDSNQGKSFVLADLCHAVATGRTWFGKQCERGAVIYFAVEGGAKFPARVAALCQVHGSATPPFAVWRGDMDLSKPGAVDGMIGQIEAAAELFGLPVLLNVIDTLSATFGAADPNSTDAMTVFIGHVSKVAKRTGAHCAVVHHSGKDKAKGARGSSALRAAIDSEFEVEAGEVITTKQRDMDKAKPIAFHLEPAVIGNDPDGLPVGTLILRQGAAPTFDAVPVELTPTERAVVEAFERVQARKLDENPGQFPDGNPPISTKEWHLECQKLTGCQFGDKPMSRQAHGLHTAKLTAKGVVRKGERNQWFMVNDSN